MNLKMRRLSRLLLALGFALVMLLAALPAQASAEPPTTAWHLKVDFPNNQLRAVYTRYTFSGDPVTVAQLHQFDITSRCQTQGTLTFDTDGYAIFDGKTAIRCPLPPPVAGMGGNRQPLFWMGADVRLTTNNRSNPLIEARRGNSSEFILSAPRNGASARTRLQLYGQDYLTAPWSPGTSSQIALGAGGKNIVALADALELENVPVLDYVPAWRDYFATFDPDGSLDQLHQPSGATWSSAFSLPGAPWTYPSEVFIGYSPSTGKFFEGGLRHLEIDPPGCRGI